MMRTTASSTGVTILSGACESWRVMTGGSAIVSSRAWARAVPLIPRPAAAASPTPAYVILVKRIAVSFRWVCPTQATLATPVVARVVDTWQSAVSPLDPRPDRSR